MSDVVFAARVFAMVPSGRIGVVDLFLYSNDPRCEEC
jgi:hypothetical protein